MAIQQRPDSNQFQIFLNPCFHLIIHDKLYAKYNVFMSPVILHGDWTRFRSARWKANNTKILSGEFPNIIYFRLSPKIRQRLEIYNDIKIV